MRTPRRNQLPWAIGMGLAISAGTAFAEPPDGRANNDIGLMTFPNVRVQTAPAVQPKPATAAPISTEAKAKTQAENRSLQRSAPAAAPVSEAGLETIYGPGGAIGVRLGEESLVYQVAHKRADGIELKEIIGKQAADHDVNGKKGDVQNEVGRGK